MSKQLSILNTLLNLFLKVEISIRNGLFSNITAKSLRTGIKTKWVMVPDRLNLESMLGWKENSSCDLHTPLAYVHMLCKTSHTLSL